MNKFTFEYCKNKNNNIAIGIKSEKEFQQIKNITKQFTNSSFSDIYQSDSSSEYNRIAITCKDTWSSVKYFKEMGYKIISCKQLF